MLAQVFAREISDLKGNNTSKPECSMQCMEKKSSSAEERQAQRNDWHAAEQQFHFERTRARELEAAASAMRGDELARERALQQEVAQGRTHEALVAELRQQVRDAKADCDAHARGLTAAVQRLAAQLAEKDVELQDLRAANEARAAAAAASAVSAAAAAATFKSAPATPQHPQQHSSSAVDRRPQRPLRLAQVHPAADLSSHRGGGGGGSAGWILRATRSGAPHAAAQSGCWGCCLSCRRARCGCGCPCGCVRVGCAAARQWRHHQRRPARHRQGEGQRAATDTLAAAAVAWPAGLRCCFCALTSFFLFSVFHVCVLSSLFMLQRSTRWFLLFLFFLQTLFTAVWFVLTSGGSSLLADHPLAQWIVRELSQTRRVPSCRREKRRNCTRLRDRDFVIATPSTPLCAPLHAQLAARDSARALWLFSSAV